MTGFSSTQSRPRAEGGVPALFVYQGEVIHDRGEMLSLTDMWRAAGGDGQQAPAKWRALPSTRAFVEHVEITIGKSDSDLFATRNGGNAPGTWAHWQVALAYAKYLSPEFHMWCNEVVRDRMTKKPPQIDHGKIGRQMAAIFDDKLARVIDQIPALIDRAVDERIAADPRRAVLDYVSVRQILADAKALQKGRDRINRKIARELRDRVAATSGISRLPCPNSGVWLYPRGFATLYMSQRGNALVREHNDRVMGQGVIKFPDRRRKPTDQPADSAPADSAPRPAP